jgi:CHAT domain-containing protein
VKKLVPIVLALCCYATFCSPKDTTPPSSWGRTVEPMLSDGQTWQPCERLLMAADDVVADVRCGTNTLLDKQICDFGPAEAVRVLGSYKECTDRVIELLEPQAATNAAARSDLLAAYYIRAQRDKRATDLMKALQLAPGTTEKTPADVFNHALLLEAVGLDQEAIEQWNAFLSIGGKSPWTKDAREHRDRLENLQKTDAAVTWVRNRSELREALRTRDARKVSNLIAPSPSGAQAYLENELLAPWAAAPSPQTLQEALLLATAIDMATHDHFAHDVVTALQQPGHQTDLLREGHNLLAAARTGIRLGEKKDVLENYDRAARALAGGGSPLYLAVRLEAANYEIAQVLDTEQTLVNIESVEDALQTLNYPNLLAFARATHAYALTWTNPVQASALYTDALTAYTELQDEAQKAGMRARLAGVSGLLGDKELALHEAVVAMRGIHRIGGAERRHAVLGEISDAVLTFGEPAIALAYQNRAVAMLETDLTRTDPRQRGLISSAQKNLSIALRKRAGIHAALDQLKEARADLERAIRFLPEDDPKKKQGIERELWMRVEEMQGRLETDLEKAIAAFDKAIAHAKRDEFLSFRANLFAQRAEAKQKAHRPAAEIERDLREALDVLHKEETIVLRTRKAGQSEKIWNPYFARFQDTYARLMRHYVDTGEPWKAFEIAERARTIELMNLLQRFKGLSPAGPDRGKLGTDTFVVEYAVLSKRAYCWVVSDEGKRFFPLTIERTQMDALVNAMSAEAHRHVPDVEAFDAAARSAHAALFEAPMQWIRSRSRLPRIVIVPDGPMHGLSFAALRSAEQRYVIHDAIIEYAGSLKLYRHSLIRDAELTPVRSPTMLMVGNPRFERTRLTRDLRDLPHAETEARRIADAYGPGAETLLKGDATIERFLEMAQTKTIVHFAGHALVNPVNPERSMLLFAPSSGDNGSLYAADLLKKLKLDRTKLVVLAACSSAGGLPVGPEGVAPLVRPILAARVPAVVGSLWLVDDATAEKFFVSFHASYGKGEDAAAALRSAQLASIRSNDRNSVFAWAPYQVIGHSSSPFGGTQK